MYALHASRISRYSRHDSGPEQVSLPSTSSLIPVPRLSIAPMVDVTGTPFRLLERLVSRNTVVYTPMIVDRQLLHINNNTRQRIASYDPFELEGPSIPESIETSSLPHAAPLIAQISGCNADTLAATAHYLASQGYPALNINMGCPASSAQNGAHGAVLMLDRTVWAAIGRVRRELAVPRSYATVPQTDTPADLKSSSSHASTALELPPVDLSIKCRLGVDAPADYAWFRTWAMNMVSGSGVAHLIVHGRIAKLADNTKRNLTVPPLHPHFAAHLRADMHAFLARERVRVRLFQLLNPWDETRGCYVSELTGAPYVVVDVDFAGGEGAGGETTQPARSSNSLFSPDPQVLAVRVRLARAEEPYLYDVVSRTSDDSGTQLLEALPGLARTETAESHSNQLGGLPTVGNTPTAAAAIALEDCPLLASAPQLCASLTRLRTSTATPTDLAAISAALLAVPAPHTPLVPPHSPPYYLSGAPTAPRRHHAPAHALVEYNGGIGGAREAAEHAWGVAGTLRGETKGNANAGQVVRKGRSGTGKPAKSDADLGEASATSATTSETSTEAGTPPQAPTTLTTSASPLSASSPRTDSSTQTPLSAATPHPLSTPVSTTPAAISARISAGAALPPPLLLGVMVGRAAQAQPLFPAFYDAQLSAMAIAAHELADMRAAAAAVSVSPAPAVSGGGEVELVAPRMTSLLGAGEVPLERVSDTGLWLRSDGSWPGQTASDTQPDTGEDLASLPIPMRMRRIRACPHPSLPTAFSRLDVLDAFLGQVDRHCFDEDYVHQAFAPSIGSLLRNPTTGSASTPASQTTDSGSVLSADGLLAPAGPLLARAELGEAVLAQHGFSLRDPARMAEAMAQLDKVAAFAECVAVLEDVLAAVDARTLEDASARLAANTQRVKQKHSSKLPSAATNDAAADADELEERGSSASSSALAALRATLASEGATWRSREEMQAALMRYGFSSVNDFKSRLNTLTTKLSRLANDTAYTHMDQHLRLFTPLDIVTPLTSLFSGVYNADYWKRICAQAMILGRKPEAVAGAHRDVLLAASRRNLVALVAAEELAQAQGNVDEEQLLQDTQSYLAALAKQTSLPALVRDDFQYDPRTLRYDNHTFTQMDAAHRLGLGTAKQYYVSNPRHAEMFAGGSVGQSSATALSSTSMAASADLSAARIDTSAQSSSAAAADAEEEHPYTASVRARVAAYRTASDRYVEQQFITPFLRSDAIVAPPSSSSPSPVEQTKPPSFSSTAAASAPPMPLRPASHLLPYCAVDLQALSPATLTRLCAAHSLDEQRLRASPVQRVGVDYSRIDEDGGVPSDRVAHVYNPHLPLPTLPSAAAAAAAAGAAAAATAVEDEDVDTASNRRILRAHSASLLSLPQHILPDQASSRRYRTGLTLDIASHVSNTDARHRPWLAEALPLVAELDAAAGESDEAFLAALARMSVPPQPPTADGSPRFAGRSGLPRLSEQVALFIRKLQRTLCGGHAQPSQALGHALRPSDSPLQSLTALRGGHHLAAVARESLGSVQTTLSYLRDQIALIDARGAGVEFERVEGEDKYGRAYSMEVEKNLAMPYHRDVEVNGKYAGCLTSHALRTPIIDYQAQQRLYTDALAVVMDIHNVSSNKTG